MIKDAIQLEDLIATTPALGPVAATTLGALYRHPSAPYWYQGAGDRLSLADLDRVRAFAGTLATQRDGRERRPTPAILAWARDRIAATPFLRRLVKDRELASDWTALPSTGRADLAQGPEYWVPDDADLARMILYRTAGTSGHALGVPSDPVAVNAYLPLIQYALGRWGLTLELAPERVSHFLVGHQARTVSYPASFSYWNGAGFAKLNLHPDAWRDPADAQAYFDAFQPQFLAGDPLSFAAMANLGLVARPLALLTTAVAMSPALKDLLREQYGCPVIDWYSLTETGPLAYACPLGEGYHWLPPDIHLETLGQDGRPTEGVGEICVTGGRNPFLPLFRYRTGDWGRLDFSPCACGDPMPRLLDLEGREPVALEDGDGVPVNPVDVSRVLREFPVLQHALTQFGDRRVRVEVRPVAGRALDLASLRAALGALFGGAPLEVQVNLDLGQAAKVIPYRREP